MAAPPALGASELPSGHDCRPCDQGFQVVALAVPYLWMTLGMAKVLKNLHSDPLLQAWICGQCFTFCQYLLTVGCQAPACFLMLMSVGCFCKLSSHSMSWWLLNPQWSLAVMPSTWCSGKIASCENLSYSVQLKEKKNMLKLRRRKKIKWPTSINSIPSFISVIMVYVEIKLWKQLYLHCDSLQVELCMLMCASSFLQDYNCHCFKSLIMLGI